MLRGYRGILVAAFVGLALGYPIHERANAQGRPSEDQAEARQNAPPASPVAIENTLTRIASAIEAAQANPDTRAAEERAENDLKAQQDMAKWAMWMFGATLATVLLTGVGVLLIWRTLVHTRRASKYAGVGARQARRAAIASDKMALEAANATIAASEAAKAGQDANEIARDTARRQLRAYIGVHETRFEKPLVKNRRMRGFIKYRNNGQTPARNIKSNLQILAMIERKGLPISLKLFELPDLIEKEGGSESDLGNGEVGEQSAYSAVEVPEDLEQRVTNGSAILFIRGVIRYTDVFGETHETRYAWHRDQEAIRHGQELLATPGGNRAD